MENMASNMEITYKMIYCISCRGNPTRGGSAACGWAVEIMVMNVRVL
jgi:hypothetical protein